MEMIEEKKGISPLVATGLLILLSLVLGVFVMNWGQKYIEEKAEFVNGGQEVSRGCEAVELKLIKLKGAPVICKRGDIVEARLENGYATEIWDIEARVISSQGSTQEKLLATPMQKGADQKVSIKTAAGDIMQVKLTPYIKKGKEILPCEKKIITVENVGMCM